MVPGYLCHHHRRQPAYFILAALVSIATGWLTGLLPVPRPSATRADAKRIEEQVQASERRILGYLGQTFIVNPDELARRYPIGYVLFLSDGRSIYVPDESNISPAIAFDWTKAHLEYQEGRVVVTLPDISDSEHGSKFNNNAVAIERGDREAKRLRLAGAFPFEIYVQLLEDRGGSILGLVGFAPRKHGGGDFIP